MENNNASTIGKNVKENFHEFKNCVLLHEKGLAMQECKNPLEDIDSKGRHKSNTFTNKIQQFVQLNENLEEVNELRLQFKERHQ